MELGPKYGYFQEPSNLVIVVSEDFVEEARSIFQAYGIKVTTGSKFLGCFVGECEGVESFLLDKVNFWVKTCKDSIIINVIMCI